jgi:hypothetical protein
MKVPLSALRSRYNPEMGLITGSVYNVGYHTALPGLSSAHPYRENALHALAFLKSNGPEDHAFGRDLLARVLAGQDTEMVSPWYGIWGWFAEELPSQMKPADWNWADFLGGTLLGILMQASDRLTPELLTATKAALGHAAWSIFRRNVTLDYTNIALMGAAITLGAGQALDEPRLLDYGRQRLAALRLHFETRGVAEYNSPNYSMLAINEIERVLALPLPDDVRADAEFIHRFFWKFVANHFHPATAQWGGPHSRNYTDFLKEETRKSIQERLGFLLVSAELDQPIVASPSSMTMPDSNPVFGLTDPTIFEPPAVPCPEDLRERFKALPSSPHEYLHIWTRNSEGEPDMLSTTWFNDRATLGSISHDICWYQAQPVVGYWRGADGGLGRLRVRVLLEGKDFASAQLRSVQKGAQVLCSVEILSKEGTYHPHFDKPSDGFFQIRDLRVRIEVEGQEAHAVHSGSNATGNAQWKLSAADSSVSITPGPGSFDGIAVTHWEVGGKGSLAWVDGVLHSGGEHPFHPSQAKETILAFALTLANTEVPLIERVTLERTSSGFCATTESSEPLSLNVPMPARRSRV